MSSSITARQQLLQIQQDLIELMPTQVDVELRYQDEGQGEIRLSTVRKGGPHPNHTHITVYTYSNYADHKTRFSIITQQGRKHRSHEAVAIDRDAMHKLVKQHLYILGVRSK